MILMDVNVLVHAHRVIRGQTRKIIDITIISAILSFSGFLFDECHENDFEY